MNQSNPLNQRLIRAWGTLLGFCCALAMPTAVGQDATEADGAKLLRRKAIKLVQPVAAEQSIQRVKPASKVHVVQAGGDIEDSSASVVRSNASMRISTPVRTESGLGNRSPLVMPEIVPAPGRVMQAIGIRHSQVNAVELVGGEEPGPHRVRPRRQAIPAGPTIAGSRPELRAAPTSPSTAPATAKAHTAAVSVRPAPQVISSSEIAPAVWNGDLNVSIPGNQVKRRTTSAGQPQVVHPKHEFAPSPAPLKLLQRPSAKPPAPQSSSREVRSVYITDQPRHVNSGVTRIPSQVATPRSQVRQVDGGSILQVAPPTPREGFIPIRSSEGSGIIVNQQPNVIATDNGLNIIDEEIRAVLQLIAKANNKDLVVGPEVTGKITMSIGDRDYKAVLDAIVGVAGYSWHEQNDFLYVTGGENKTGDPRLQGRVVHVYPLNYVSAKEIEPVVNKVLSSVGSAFSNASDSQDQLKTREVLIVEDTEAAHSRVRALISRLDVRPRQVLVEAHVLQVALEDGNRHGVNLTALTRLNGSRISLTGTSFADDPADGPSLALRVDGTDMDSLIELIRTNTNSRTLASPKVSVVNHQEARIQIGQRLPYSVATTTQTSTIQNVQFLEVGIVLTVEPIITKDGNVMMTVSPKVSGGRITESGFPEEDTTELSTTILMRNGGGVVIGGLIREEDSDTTASVPGLGRLPGVGRLFQRKTSDVRRNELIIALVTHVLPDVQGDHLHETRQLEINQLNCALPDHAKIELRNNEIPYSQIPANPGTYHIDDGIQVHQPQHQPFQHQGASHRTQPRATRAQPASTRRYQSATRTATGQSHRSPKSNRSQR